MPEQIRISAKNLGALAFGDLCLRCAWLMLRLCYKLPFQIFPGIFSSIDAATKRVVHGFFDVHGRLPDWLAELGPVVGYCEPPHYSKFNTVIDRHNVLLTGTPDGVFVRPDASHIIVDYKTAKFTGTQDSLFPMYEAQLNAYALLGEQCGFNPVAGLALVYMEPVTDEPSDAASHCNELGFEMGFSAHVLRVRLKPDLIDPLLARVREIHDMPTSPPGRPGCKDCQLVDRLVSLAQAPRPGRVAPGD
jgi:hypothetical protein